MSIFRFSSEAAIIGHTHANSHQLYDYLIILGNRLWFDVKKKKATLSNYFTEIMLHIDRLSQLIIVRPFDVTI